MLEYTIAIATRNRLEALKLSIPRMLAQSRTPAQLVVVDSSDDHALIAKTVRSLTASTDIDVQVIENEKGLTRQRNRAIEAIKHPVVFFPDDDSIWFPGVAEETLRTYELDSDRAIGAVCASESMTPPSDFENSPKLGYSMNREDKLRQRIAKFRYRMENSVVPDAAKLLGRSFYSRFNKKDWMEDNNVGPVEWMTGFRMSFRTDLIKKVRFCEEFVNYSLFEDIDASFGIWRTHSIVAARNAKVFHFKSPEKRGDGTRLGIEQIVNKAYIVAKYSDTSDPCRRAMLRFARYKTFQYLLGSRSQFGRERYVGAKAALAALPDLISAVPESANESYRKALAQIAASLPKSP